ncbi:MAG: glycosyltransferase family 2 protein [Candidatus Amesbacteria bacterium]|nr:glycosyltransferase family 2 protein [Candidatus Amesbacteria bacterium]
MSKLSVIIPAYNEEKRLGSNLSSVLKYLHKNFSSFELIIVDDGSTDSMAKSVRLAIAKDSRARLISYKPNRGKGYAVRNGVLASQGEQVLFMDADLSTPLVEIPKILTKLESADIVIGSRGKSDAPFGRQVASFIFDQIKYMMVGLRRFRDTQCGFKAFRGEIARKLFAKSQVDRFMFDVEILYLAEKSKLKIIELHVDWSDVPDSKVRFWEGVVNMFRDLWRIRSIH